MGDTLAASKRGIVKCRICKEDHWTTQCPYKDTLGPLRESLTGPVDEADAAPGAAPAAAAPAPVGGGKTLLPSGCPTSQKMPRKPTCRNCSSLLGTLPGFSLPRTRCQGSARALPLLTTTEKKTPPRQLLASMVLVMTISSSVWSGRSLPKSARRFKKESFGCSRWS